MLKVQDFFLDEIVFKGCGLLTNYYAVRRCLPEELVAITISWSGLHEELILAMLADDSREKEPDDGKNKHLKIEILIKSNRANQTKPTKSRI